MNSNIFNLNRFGRYLVTDIKTAIANFGLSLLIVATLGLSFDIVSGLFSLVIRGSWSGMDDAFRISLFVISLVIVVILEPSKIYGHVTDKKEGQAFLMLPVSTLEKTISMILVSCIIVPLVFFAIYLSVDFLVCLADPTCGKAILITFNDIRFDMLNGLSSNLEELKPFIDNPTAFANPALFIDDAIQIPLIFLLGAIYFKKSKPAKTFATLIMIGIVIGLIASAATSGLTERIQDFVMSVDNKTVMLSDFREYFPVLSWIANHLFLIDTVSDTLVNLLLCFLIWLRIKKLNH